MRKYLILLFVIGLSGCSAMNNDFDCNKVGGIKGCVSLDEVNHMVDSGQLGSNKQSTQANNKESSGSNVKPTLGYRNGIPDIGQPVRFGDQIQQITIFPYEDRDGNYHEASVVYSVLKKSYWIDHPVVSVKTDNHED